MLKLELLVRESDVYYEKYFEAQQVECKKYLRHLKDYQQGFVKL